jgi:protein involved in polysaccharide export with SLBB domain
MRKRTSWLVIGAVVAGVVLSAGQAHAQRDQFQTGVLTPGATANYRFADANELPITVTLLGPVARPGRYEISRKIDLLNLIALSGGWLDQADMANVTISRVRSSADPLNRTELLLDLENPSEIAGKFLQLQEGDYVYVGTSHRLTLPVILSIVAAATAITTAIAYISYYRR